VFTRIDDLTVDIETTGPNPVLVEYLFQPAIMNKVWCVKHNVEKAQDYAHKEEPYAARNANGTGPHMLKSREPDVKYSRLAAGTR
jgi:peptide/nickel transport system substrate-binding protein